MEKSSPIAKRFQKYHMTATFGYTLGYPVCALIAAVSLFLLCLTSRTAQLILQTKPFQFMGQISFCLYLIHGLFLDWPMKELQIYLSELGMNYDYAAILVFILFTPPLIVTSWFLTNAIDVPAKNLVIDIDMNCRKDPPKPRKGKEPIKQVGILEFLLTR